ncbi:MAG: YbjN domain-containing protein [bacterium]|nr:YbjN domain-containing protein [bacterium]
MEFANDNHRAAYDRVKTYLTELFDEDLYHEEETGHIYVRYGSTVLEISVDPYGPEDATMTAMAYCVQDVEVDEELLRGLLELNHTLPFGSFSLVGRDIFFSHALFGRTLERSNLLSAIAAVATISDDYDDRIVARYGGERALDRIRHTGGRERRRETLKL